MGGGAGPVVLGHVTSQLCQSHVYGFFLFSVLNLDPTVAAVLDLLVLYVCTYLRALDDECEEEAV